MLQKSVVMFVYKLFLQEEGDNGLVGAGMSSTRAVYQCWFGLELEPAESEVRYCIQGKWTGENPQCGMHCTVNLKSV